MDEKNVATVTLTPAVAKTKINLALTTHNIVLQTLQTEADSIEKNEDHLVELKTVIDKIKKGKKLIDDKHAEIKKPYLESSRACDVAKNELIGLYDAILNPVLKTYNDLCTAVAKKKRDDELKEQKKRDTLQLIETTVVDFSTKIGACSTRQQLIDVERLINLEKGSTRANKYTEWHQQAIDRFNEVLIPAITEQKKVVEQLEAVAGQVKVAQESGDIDKLEELEQEHDSIKSVLNNNQIKVQERAIFNEFPDAPQETVTVIHPTVPKGGRTDYDIEIVDLEAAIKKSRGLLTIELKTADAKALARTFAEAGNFDKTDTITVGGIRYTKKKVY